METHKRAVDLFLGVYNFVRRHETLKTTPAVAAGVELKRWNLEQVVEMTEAYWKPRLAEIMAKKATARRLSEDAIFEKALAGT